MNEVNMTITPSLVSNCNDGEISLTDSINKFALSILLNNLKKYGNLPDQIQISALASLIRSYTGIAMGYGRGRVAFGIPTGGGKTQSIVAWVTSIAMHKVYNVSVLVSASKVEALCDLKRLILSSLEEHGASVSLGLLHSYKHDAKADTNDLPDGYASEPSDRLSEVDSKQILLVTHAKVRGRADVDTYNLYKGEPRNVVIYDESLLISDTRGISLRELEAGIDCLSHFTPETGSKREAMEYLKRASELFRKDLQEQKQGREPQQIYLEPLKTSQIDTYVKAIGEGNGRKFWMMALDLQALLNLSQQPLRVLSIEQGSGFITYDLAVSKGLKNIVVLDASHNIRELCKLDKTIFTVSSNFQISHEATTVKFWKHPSGRYSVSKSFRAAKRENRKISQVICETVKTIPDNEAVLFFTFKQRYRKDPDFRGTLEKDLKASGIDIKAKLSNGKSKYNWLTWGNETSLNEYAFCKHVIMVGVLHPPMIELVAMMAGQREDLMFEIDHDEIRRIELGECAHYIYQGFSRSASRIIRNCKSEGATLYLMYNDKRIKDVLDIVLPDATWKTWKTESTPVKEKTSVEKIREVIIKYLSELPQSVTKVSSQKIRKDLNLKSVPHTTFTRAINEIKDINDWIFSGKSFERTLFDF